LDEKDIDAETSLLGDNEYYSEELLNSREGIRIFLIINIITVLIILVALSNFLLLLLLIK